MGALLALYGDRGKVVPENLGPYIHDGGDSSLEPGLCTISARSAKHSALLTSKTEVITEVKVGLSGKQIRTLRRMANGLGIIVNIGKEGITKMTAKQAEEALEAHELIRCSVLCETGAEAREAGPLAKPLLAPQGEAPHLLPLHQQYRALLQSLEQPARALRFEALV